MRKALTTFGDGWIEVTPTKITSEEMDILLDLDTSDEDRERVRRVIRDRSSRKASDEDSRAAHDALAVHYEGEFTCATVILPAGRGFVVHAGGWIRF
jgi:hypothetical protein